MKRLFVFGLVAVSSCAPVERTDPASAAGDVKPVITSLSPAGQRFFDILELGDRIAIVRLEKVRYSDLSDSLDATATWTTVTPLRGDIRSGDVLTTRHYSTEVENLSYCDSRNLCERNKNLSAMVSDQFLISVSRKLYRDTFPTQNAQAGENLFRTYAIYRISDGHVQTKDQVTPVDMISDVQKYFGHKY